MLLPAGHSSSLKIIGQFSMVIFTPCALACSTIGGQISSARSQFASTWSDGSPPMNVLKNGTPILAQASITSFWCPIAASRTSRVGVHRVRIEAKP